MANVPESVPPECSDSIWWRLSENDLLLMMRVSRVWRQSMERFLYKRISIRTSDCLHALLRTMKERPDLAASVQHLHLDSTLPTTQSDYPAAPDLGQQEVATKRLIGLLPGLHSVRFGQWLACPGILESSIQEVGPSGFPKLKTVVIKEPETSVDQLRLLCSLPAIESIETGLSAHQVSPDSWPVVASLENLRLRPTTLKENGLEVLLRACPALKTLTYDRRCNVGDKPSVIDCETLTSALSHVEGTLEELELGAHLFCLYTDEVGSLEITPVKGHLGSLRGFKTLKKLTIPLAVLLGWFPKQAPTVTEVLPGSLTHLCLSEDLSPQCTYEWSEESVLQKLELFSRAVRQTNPHLETFEFLPNRNFDRWQAPSEDRLREMCSRAGINCIIPPEEDLEL